MTDQTPQPWFDKAIRDYADKHGPSGGAWNISMLLEHFHRVGPTHLAEIAALRAERDALREALRACRRATLHGADEPRRTVREIVDEALTTEGQ